MILVDFYNVFDYNQMHSENLGDIMKSNIISSIILALGIALLGLFINQGIVAFKSFDRYVEVKGLDERIVKSNEATWSIYFSVSSDQLKELNTKVSESLRVLTEFIEANGFMSEEIQKGPLSVTDNFANSYSAKLQGPQYTARGSIVVGTKNVDLLGKMASKNEELLKQGVMLESNNISYYFTDLNLIKPEMLKAATANAREAAISFAEHSNSKLGSIRSATQGVFTIDSPFKEYDSRSSIMKKVRVVTKVSYFLE